MKYLIIGGGVAGVTTAQELRKLDQQSEIILIDQEQHPLYSRVLLAPYVKGMVDREKIFLKKETWYQENQIEWLRGVVVEKLNLKNKFVLISNGQEISFDKLVIASGSQPREIDDDLRGVSYLRDLDDAEHLIQLLKEQKENKLMMIYGGGLIVCEYLSILSYFKKDITVAFRGKHFWSKNLNDEAGIFLNQYLEKQGVKVIPHQKIKELAGNKELEKVFLEKDVVETNFLGVGIGVKSNLAWLSETDLEINQGIKVNQFLETNQKDVWAIGDVAEYFDVIAGRHLMFGNWQKAMFQGRLVAKNIMGEKIEYQQVPSYAMNILGLDLSFVGDVVLEQADQVLVRKGRDKGLTLMLIKAEKMIGAVILGRNKDRTPLTKLISSGQNIKDKITDYLDGDKVFG